MKLADLRPEVLVEFQDTTGEHNKKAITGDLGEYITTEEAGKILDVSQSRVRQFIQEKRLTAHHPVAGRRDNFLKRAEVVDFAKKERERTGRPEGT